MQEKTRTRTGSIREECDGEESYYPSLSFCDGGFQGLYSEAQY